MAEHRFPVTIYWEDTDAGGMVYHANHLRFAERARSEMLAEAGIDQAALADGADRLLAVRRCEIDYLRPARLGDRLQVVTRVLGATGARVLLDQRVIGGDQAGQHHDVAALNVQIVCVDRQGRARRLPAIVRDALLRDP
jgi:acyl-CoA thioester hydrolase